jgi:hypothetical protein
MRISIGTRRIHRTLLAGGALAAILVAGCGSAGPAAHGTGDTGGTGPTDTGTGGSAGKGGSSAGTGGSGGVTGEGGSAPTADAGATASDAQPLPPPTGDGGMGVLGPGSADDAPPLVLPGAHLIFDGKTLTGWNCDGKWSVKNGAIDATGSGNSFCKSADAIYDTFRLTGKSRIVMNPSDHAGICWWPIGNAFLQLTPVSGSLWDYRGGGEIRTLPRPPWDYTQWNFFELLVDAKTGSVDLAVEGYQYPTYIDKKAHNKGAIALQLHAQPNEVQYKDLAVEVNPTVMKLLTAIPGKMPGKTPAK